MNIVHSDRTRVGKDKQAAADDLPAAASVLNIAGALFLSAEAEGEKDVYELVTTDRIDELIEPHPCGSHVIGDSREIIESQINARHLSPRVEVTYVLPFNNLERTHWRKPTEDELRYRSKERFQTTHTIKEGWIILDRPYLADPQDIAQLKYLTMELGPLLIAEDDHCRLFGGFDASRPNTLGFTFSTRRIWNKTFIQINYNPRSLHWKSFRQAKRAIAKRLCGDFPNAIYQSLYGYLSPGHWPSWHPFKRAVAGKDLTVSAGWGNTRRLNFDCDEVLAALDLTRRLMRGVKVAGDDIESYRFWWRYEGHPYGVEISSFKETIEQALVYIHGVEQKARKDIEKASAEIDELYDEHERKCDDYEQAKAEYLAALLAESEGMPTLNPKLERRPKQYPREKERKTYDVLVKHPAQSDDMFKFIACWLNDQGTDSHYEPQRHGCTKEENRVKRLPDAAGRAFEHLRLCRWIRAEAKALKIEIPAAPQPPKPPPKLKKRKAARRRKRKRSKQRVAVDALRLAETLILGVA